MNRFTYSCNKANVGAEKLFKVFFKTNRKNSCLWLAAMQIQLQLDGENCEEKYSKIRGKETSKKKKKYYCVYANFVIDVCRFPFFAALIFDLPFSCSLFLLLFLFSLFLTNFSCTLWLCGQTFVSSALWLFFIDPLTSTWTSCGIMFAAKLDACFLLHVDIHNSKWLKEEKQLHKSSIQ